MIRRAPMSRHRHKLSKKAGLPPGTLHLDGKPMTGPIRITVIDYDADHVEERRVMTIEECFPYRDTSTVTWINIDGLANTEVIEKIGRYFLIHPLILEDLLNTDQRPKMEDLEDYLYLNLKMLMLPEATGEIKGEHVSLIIGKNYLMSFQEDVGDVFDPVRERIRKEGGRVRKNGSDYLAYALIDNIVDNYFVVMEKIEERVESLEEELVVNATRDSLPRINRLKKDMVFLRKAVWPLREMILALERSDSPLIREDTRIYLRDVYDHAIQVIDTLETFRDMVSGMIDIYLSSLSYKMNEIMKVLTLIATIFIPLTFVAGVYGMNFRYMPELHWEYGYYAVLGIMIAIVVIMLAYFRKRQWI
ncbi:MAG TPA: magnesium/cobalt transporter CorA [Methanoregulaceae archaeon]|nr:magnesium/cobalt transporter CorA [Methanoregulaceae archaeon]HPD10484.1 magnesium/cobalt transporter CorA [Methanoregulaceae archaeon]HRT15503.1 magnesium/cobalt transporter CorA [Methanoregulaceae archaeon]HRU31107.1 magnesium/cobalt transporter CorA [Methanoregulaceae archaeon]